MESHYSLGHGLSTEILTEFQFLGQILFFAFPPLLGMTVTLEKFVIDSDEQKKSINYVIVGLRRLEGRN